jgi:hypothetical protein
MPNTLVTVVNFSSILQLCTTDHTDCSNSSYSDDLLCYRFRREADYEETYESQDDEIDVYICKEETAD